MPHIKTTVKLTKKDFVVTKPACNLLHSHGSWAFFFLVLILFVYPYQCPFFSKAWKKENIWDKVWLDSTYNGKPGNYTAPLLLRLISWYHEKDLPYQSKSFSNLTFPQILWVFGLILFILKVTETAVDWRKKSVILNLVT